MQLVINLILFFWLFLLTAYLAVERYQRTNTDTGALYDQLKEEVRQSQELLNILSQELLLLSEQVGARASGVQEEKDLSVQVKPLEQEHPTEEHLSYFPQRYGEIFKRINLGQEVADIARDMGMGQGEIELILTLNRQIDRTNHKS